MSAALPDVHHERNILAWRDSVIFGQPVAASRRRGLLVANRRTPTKLFRRYEPAS